MSSPTYKLDEKLTINSAVPNLPYLAVLPKPYIYILIFLGKKVMITCKPPFLSN